MRNLSTLICLLALSVNLWAQSPHGAELKISCDDCHKTKGWTVDLKTIDFHHDTTGFALVGQHQSIDCKSCHTTIVFSAASTECVSCHTDMHNQTVSMDCNQCHTPQSWLVPNITEIHQMSRFPLLGAHATADCNSCHPSASTLNFQPQGIECIDCHQADYQATTDPNHVDGNFSTNCVECHFMNVFSWTGAGIDHSFFPLTQGHALNDCYQCHKQGEPYNSISPECISCHQSDFLATTNPNHVVIDLSTECLDCHTTIPGWNPAKFTIHDAQFFPIYSGEHKGEWDNCIDCHTNTSNYAQFTCTGCHEHSKADTDDEHDDVGGYIYESQACFDCHPTGSGEGGFNHNLSNFPLTGAHTTTDCIDCHASGFSGTTTVCYECHTNEYNQAVNPPHSESQFSTDCETCHTTVAWQPATFDHDDQYFPIYSGKHEGEWNSCAECHTNASDYAFFSCIDCHDHNKIDTDDEHNGLSGYLYTSDACYACHPTGSAEGGFNHDLTNFPLTGAHNSVECFACHTNGYPGTSMVCVDCHQADFNQSTNPNHVSLGLSTACQNCHTTNPDWIPATFDVHNDYYPIIGAHTAIANDCSTCHQGNYNNTPNSCVGCHLSDYNQTNDPPHASAQFSTECEACHSQTAWVPSTFNHDDQYFPIYSGKHRNEWNSCTECHTNPSDYGDFSCIDCHEHNQSSMNSEHNGVSGYQYNSDACLDCHPDGSDRPQYINQQHDY